MTRVKDPNKYPPGLDRQKVAAIIRHYEKQPEADAVADVERAIKAEVRISNSSKKPKNI